MHGKHTTTNVIATFSVIIMKVSMHIMHGLWYKLIAFVPNWSSLFVCVLQFCSHQGWILGHTLYRVSAFLLTLITVIVDDATADTYGLSYFYFTRWCFFCIM